MLRERIEIAYDELIEANKEFLLIGTEVDSLKEAVLEEHFDELKGQRSNEARNQVIGFWLKDDEEYQGAREALVESRARLETARLQVERLKLLAQIGGLS
jgi:hypothetical protein